MRQVAAILPANRAAVVPAATASPTLQAAGVVWRYVKTRQLRLQIGTPVTGWRDQLLHKERLKPGSHALDRDSAFAEVAAFALCGVEGAEGSVA